MTDKCPYHDDLVEEVKLLEKSISTIEHSTEVLRQTCENLNANTVKSHEFYEEMLKHYDKESVVESTLNRKNLLLYFVCVLAGLLLGGYVPQLIP